MAPASTRRHAEAGQAGVELVALLPVLAVGLLACWLAAATAHAAWSAQAAARAAARAHAVGADPRAAARGVLPSSLERRLSVRARDDGRVAVRIAVPAAAGIDVGHVTATSHFPGQ